MSRCFPGIFLCLLTSAAALSACGGEDANSPKRPPLAEQWLERARASYKAGDFDDAKTSADSAFQIAPKDPDIRVMKGRIALANLEFAEAAKFTALLTSMEARQIRGRAHWYNGDFEAAADDLETVALDPKVRDTWAREVAKLARQGQGRKPFALEGQPVGAVEMPLAGPALVVPCELDSEPILALVATGVSELIIDSTSRKEPAWVQLKFGGLEVRDVPALTQDLSAIAKQYGGPIKALLGVNLLRKAHATFDRRGSQFVVRREDAIAPPDAVKIPLFYVRGGGLVMRASVSKDGARSAFLVDTTVVYPLALEESSIKKAGIDPATLRSDPNAPPNMKVGRLPGFRFGGFEIPDVDFVQGSMQQDARSNVDVDLGGVIGAGMLAPFRVTFGDEGRIAYFEPDPTLDMQQQQQTRRPEPTGIGTSVPGDRPLPPKAPPASTAAPKAPPASAAPKAPAAGKK